MAPEVRWLSVQRVPGSRSANCTGDLWHSFAPYEWRSGVTTLLRVGVTASQLDLQSLTPLSVTGYGRLQLGAVHFATSVTLVQVVNN